MANRCLLRREERIERALLHSRRPFIPVSFFHPHLPVWSRVPKDTTRFRWRWGRGKRRKKEKNTCIYIYIFIHVERRRKKFNVSRDEVSCSFLSTTDQRVLGRDSIKGGYLRWSFGILSESWRFPPALDSATLSLLSASYFPWERDRPLPLPRQRHEKRLINKLIGFLPSNSLSSFLVFPSLHVFSVLLS